MFDASSRYHLTETTVLHTPERQIPYLRRRFLPQPESMSILVEVSVAQGDRLDLIAARTLGAPEQSWRVCDANYTMNPFDLTAEPGRVLRVPVPGFEVPR
jgi:hypothetical protein